MSKRSSIVKLSKEAKVLKRLRQEKSLSMRAASGLLGISDSTISHIENGRMDVPSGNKLKRFLKVYGVGEKSFQEKVKNFSELRSEQDDLFELIPKLQKRDRRVLLNLTKSMLENKGVD